MNKKHPKDWSKFTPETTQAWGLAMYPIIVLVLAVFMVVTRRPITTDISGLFLGLTVAGSLQAAVKRKAASNADSNNNDRADDDIHRSRNSELEVGDWRRPSDTNSGPNHRVRLQFG
jgi:hypothetical protein